MKQSTLPQTDPSVKYTHVGYKSFNTYQILKNLEGWFASVETADKFFIRSGPYKLKRHAIEQIDIWKSNYNHQGIE